MQNASVLALIDAYLERLGKVRLLLTTPPVAPTKGTRKRTPSLPVQSQAPRTAEKEKPAAPAPQIAEPRVSHRRKAKPLAPKKKTAASKPLVARLAKTRKPVTPAPAPLRDTQLPQKQPQKQSAPVAAKKPLPQTATATAAPVIVKVHTQRKRPALSRLTVAPPAAALGGLVPSGPVFIPADRIRQEQSQRKQESVTARRAVGPAASAPLTAELLKQRWIQSPAS